MTDSQFFMIIKASFFSDRIKSYYIFGTGRFQEPAEKNVKGKSVNFIFFFERLCSPHGLKIRFESLFSAHQGANHNCFLQQIQFVCNLFMMSAICAQLPTSWQYNRKNCKSQDKRDRKFEIYPEIREINQPEWGTECFEKGLGIA